MLYFCICVWFFFVMAFSVLFIYLKLWSCFVKCESKSKLSCFFLFAASVFFLYSDKAKSKLFLLHPEVFSFNLMIIFAIHPTCFMPDGIFKIRFYVFFHFLCLLSFLYVKGWHYNSISRRPMLCLTHLSVWHNNNTVSA